MQILKHAGFDLVLVESAGIGQASRPFARGLVEKQILVMSPDYGGRLQLQKIVMLEGADVVVVNKTDLPGARTAVSELEQRLASNQRRPGLIGTIAVAIAFPPAFVAVVVALSFLAGLAYPLRAAAIQRAVPDEVRARAASVASACDMAIKLIALPLAGAYRARKSSRR